MVMYYPVADPISHDGVRPVSDNNSVFEILRANYQTALTAAVTSVLALMIYSWFKKIPYPLFLQSASVCVFFAVVLDVTLLEWWHLPGIACVAIGAVSGFVGRPLILRWVSGKDDAVAGGLLDKVERKVRDAPDAP